MKNKILLILIIVFFFVCVQLKNKEGFLSNNIIYAPIINEPIKLDLPIPGSKISSPLFISGIAKGTWFFEGDAPVILTDWDGLIISEGYITAKEDWMTEEFVPFEGVLEFEVPEYGERGSLILRKDNPSGLPEYDDALEISILFK
jgi:immunoglobulin-like protein involved in spore germination